MTLACFDHTIASQWRLYFTEAFLVGCSGWNYSEVHNTNSAYPNASCTAWCFHKGSHELVCSTHKIKAYVFRMFVMAKQISSLWFCFLKVPVFECSICFLKANGFEFISVRTVTQHNSAAFSNCVYSAIVYCRSEDLLDYMQLNANLIYSQNWV